jgi:uncharacterized protein (TIGR00255 family)
LKKMINSMTGYGRAEALGQDRKWVVEIKSLNHRYLEAFIRLPAALQPLEAEVKKKIGGRLSRGRIEAAIRMESDGAQEEEARFDLNLPAIRHYHTLLLRLKETFSLDDKISVGMLAGLKDAFVYQERELNLDEAWKGMEPALEEALMALAEMRRKEGEMILADLRLRIGLIVRCLDGIASRAPQVVEHYHKRLSERVMELTGGVPIDEARLVQEVAIMAERMDITEEIVRFRSHLEQLEDMLAGHEAVGRKMDFLLQEMNREVNTIGSKSSDTDISRHVVEIKSELSKMREQAQNVE